MMFRVRSRIPSFLFCFLAALVSPVTNHLNYGLNPNDVLLVSYSVCSCSFYVWSVTSFHLTFFDDFIAQCLHNLMSGVMLLFTSQDKERDKPKTHTKRKDKKKLRNPVILSQVIFRSFMSIIHSPWFIQHSIYFLVDLAND